MALQVTPGMMTMRGWVGLLRGGPERVKWRWCVPVGRGTRKVRGAGGGGGGGEDMDSGINVFLAGSVGREGGYGYFLQRIAVVVFWILHE